MQRFSRDFHLTDLLSLFLIKMFSYIYIYIYIIINSIYCVWVEEDIAFFSVLFFNFIAFDMDHDVYPVISVNRRSVIYLYI